MVKKGSEYYLKMVSGLPSQQKVQKIALIATSSIYVITHTDTHTHVHTYLRVKKYQL